jgi:hypothetical protein
MSNGKRLFAELISAFQVRIRGGRKHNQKLCDPSAVQQHCLGKVRLFFPHIDDAYLAQDRMLARKQLA